MHTSKSIAMKFFSPMHTQPALTLGDSDKWYSWVNALTEVMILFWLVGFIVSWLFWFKFANKKRSKEIFPVGIFASWISFTIEAGMHYIYELWSYSDQAIYPLFGNAFGIYIVVPYFFIQWLPLQKTFNKLLLYFFVWTCFAILFEYIHWYFLQIEYHYWWNIGYSYIADWILFWVFYKYYIATDLHKLSQSKA